MTILLLVGVGGFCGAVLRYLLSSNIQRFFEASFVGTLTVNVVGCLLIGLLNGLAESRQLLNPQLRLLVLVGFLGSFTTYSTFGHDVFLLARQASFGAVLLNIGLHLSLGLGGVYLGYQLSRLF